MEKQYNFFKYLYEKEESRYKELLNRGKVFISIITFYLGLLLFKTSDYQTADAFIDTLGIKVFLYALPIILFSIAFLINILSLGIYTYEYPNDLKSLIINNENQLYNNTEFLKGRIVDFAIAMERNYETNNKRAKLLFYTSIFMFLGIIGHLIFIFANL